MKIQLDTTNKTIKIEENVLLSKLMDTLNSLLPNKEWKKYTLETNTVISHWVNPYIIERIKEVPVYPKPDYPWMPYVCNVQDRLMATSKNEGMQRLVGDYTVNDGVFNIEAKI